MNATRYRLPVRDKNEVIYRGEEGKTPVQQVVEGKNRYGLRWKVNVTTKEIQRTKK